MCPVSSCMRPKIPEPSLRAAFLYQSHVVMLVTSRVTVTIILLQCARVSKATTHQYWLRKKKFRWAGKGINLLTAIDFSRKYLPSFFFRGHSYSPLNVPPQIATSQRTLEAFLFSALTFAENIYVSPRKAGCPPFSFACRANPILLSVHVQVFHPLNFFIVCLDAHNQSKSRR